MGNKWITQKEAAKVSGNSIQTINNWIRRGFIDFKIVKSYGKKIRLVDASNKYLEKSKNKFV